MPAEALARMTRTRSSSRWPTRSPRSCRRRPRRTRGSSRPAARTTRTRSTTCSPSPGIFRGALDVRAPQITEEMKLAAAHGDRRRDRRRRAARGLHHPVGLQPRRRPGGRRGRRGRGPRRGRRRGATTGASSLAWASRPRTRATHRGLPPAATAHASGP